MCSFFLFVSGGAVGAAPAAAALGPLADAAGARSPLRCAVASVAVRFTRRARLVSFVCICARHPVHERLLHVVTDAAALAMRHPQRRSAHSLACWRTVVAAIGSAEGAARSLMLDRTRVLRSAAVSARVGLVRTAAAAAAAAAEKRDAAAAVRTACRRRRRADSESRSRCCRCRSLFALAAAVVALSCTDAQQITPQHERERSSAVVATTRNRDDH